MNIPHIPVLPQEVVNSFSHIADKEGYIIDATLGFGSHSLSLLEAFPKIRLIGIDQDNYALDFCKQRLEAFKDRTHFVRSNFSQISSIIDDLGISPTQIKGILADIGVSSHQLDETSRGFGFESDVLDMRMNQEQEQSAYDIVNYYTKDRLEHIFNLYGEVKAYKKVAHLITQERSKAPIESAKHLTQLLYAHMNPIVRGKGAKKVMHPATLVFQALRIEVNQELQVLEKFLDSIEHANFSDTTVSVISFHSLEDRIVKDHFKRWAKKCLCDDNAMRCTCGSNNQKGIIATKKPVTPSDQEIDDNPRSRSSKMRTFQFKKNR